MLKNKIKQYRGSASFLLVIIFLYAGLFRSYVVSNDSAIYATKNNKNTHEKTSFTSLENKITGLALADQFNKEESESEEIDLGFYNGFCFRPDTYFFQGVKDFYKSRNLICFKIPLYDMFCKWKFHLS